MPKKRNIDKSYNIPHNLKYAKTKQVVVGEMPSISKFARGLYSHKKQSKKTRRR